MHAAGRQSAVVNVNALPLAHCADMRLQSTTNDHRLKGCSTNQPHLKSMVGYFFCTSLSSSRDAFIFSWYWTCGRAEYQ